MTRKRSCYSNLFFSSTNDKKIVAVIVERKEAPARRYVQVLPNKSDRSFKLKRLAFRLFYDGNESPRRVTDRALITVFRKDTLLAMGLPLKNATSIINSVRRSICMGICMSCFLDDSPSPFLFGRQPISVQPTFILESRRVLKCLQHFSIVLSEPWLIFVSAAPSTEPNLYQIWWSKKKLSEWCCWP